MKKKQNKNRYTIRLLNEHYPAEVEDVKLLLSSLTVCECEDDKLPKPVHNTTVVPEVYVIIDNESSDYVVGCVSVFYEQKIARGYGVVCHLEDLVVHENHRGLDIGKKLIEFVIQQAKIHNCYKVVLDCKDDLVRYYEKSGFEATDTHMRLDI